MSYQKIATLFVALLSFTKGSGQRPTFDTAYKGLFQIEHDIVIDKFYREHIPLDGNAVRYIPFRQDKLFGFVDKQTKQQVIRPKYDQVFAVYPEGAIVEKGHGYGLVNYQDSFLIPPFFPNLYKEGGLYHGLGTSSDTSVPEFYNSFYVNVYYNDKGKFLFVAEAHQQEGFKNRDSLAWFRYGKVTSIYGKSGVLHKKIMYDAQKQFICVANNCLVFHEEESGRGYFKWYDLKGNVKHRLQRSGTEFRYVYHLSDSMFALISDDGITLCNGKGANYPFDISNGMLFSGQAGMFDSWLNGNSLLPVRDHNTGLTGYVSGKGELRIPCIYRSAGPFINGEAAYFDSAKGKIGFIDTTGRVSVQPCIMGDEPVREQATQEPLQFSEGLCLVSLGRRFTSDEDSRIFDRQGYIDHNGKLVITLPDSILMAGDFHDGLAPVSAKGGRLGFINRKGEIAIAFKYEAAVAGAYPFPQIIMPEFNNGFAYIKSFKGYIDVKGYEYFSGERLQDSYDFSH